MSESRKKKLHAKQMLFLAELLTQAAYANSNRICSDMSEDAWSIFDDDEKTLMAIAYEKWNSGGEEEPHFSHEAWPWMYWYSYKLRDAATRLMTS